MVKVHATASSYTNTIYVIFDDNDYVDKYELYRDGIKIAEADRSGITDFAQPTLFDSDKHTNLFRKKSTREFMYEDKDVAQFQEYSYYVKYYHGDSSWDSNIVYVTLA